MQWSEGPAGQGEREVQADDQGQLRHAVVEDASATDAQLAISYAESSFAAGPHRMVDLQRFEGGEAVGESWRAEVGVDTEG